MKHLSIDHWNKNKYTNKLLFFAEVFNECLFDYSFESYRVPSLNLHLLCYEICRTATDINNKVLMDGNFVPLYEELEYYLKNDLFINQCFSCPESLTMKKGKNGVYSNLINGDLKTKIKHYPEIAKYIIDLCEKNKYYIGFLFETIKNKIFSDDEDLKCYRDIYDTTRSLACELINTYYSKEYVYHSVQKFFFNPLKSIECNIDTLEDFFGLFPFEEKKYNVTFGVSYSLSKLFNDYEDTQTGEASFEEKELLGRRYKKHLYIATTSVSANDKYKAYIIVKEFYNMIISLNSLHQHTNKMLITKKAIVSEVDNENNTINQDVIDVQDNIMLKKGNISNEESIALDSAMLNSEMFPGQFYKAVSLHDNAIKSNKSSIQLLTLWTAIEVLISTKRDNEDRINTICNTLCSVLNRTYMYSLLFQLDKDLKTCYGNEYTKFINDLEIEDYDDVKKLTMVLSIKDYESNLNELRNFVDNPLLKYRIDTFASIVFNNSKSVFDFLKQHRQRIKWHIMRIYRNRNMIVHNGSYLPYLDTITENLHYYVDMLIDALLEYYANGYRNNESIYKDIFIKEAQYQKTLGQTELTKNPSIKNPIDILYENAISIIFNE